MLLRTRWSPSLPLCRCSCLRTVPSIPDFIARDPLECLGHRQKKRGIRVSRVSHSFQDRRQIAEVPKLVETVLGPHALRQKIQNLFEAQRFVEPGKHAYSLGKIVG